VTNDLTEATQTIRRRAYFNETERDSVAEYQFTLTAQSWSKDSYYVASSWPLKSLIVIADTENAALVEAERLLGDPGDYRYWRFWVNEVKDTRLLLTKEKDD